MKITMVIPSYWSRESGDGFRKEDAVYDHPTPLDENGTILRAIQSIGKLNDKDFQLVIIAVATARDIEARVENRIANIVESGSSDLGIETFLFRRSHLDQIHNLLISDGKEEHIDLLKLQGYSNIRTLCTFIPHLLDSDVAILIDDDEVFEDPEFISKAKEYIGKNIGGKIVNAVAGCYLQPNGDYLLKRKFHPWMKYWDSYQRMNEAFNKIIGTAPRLKETTFVFGGNMVIHKNLFTVIPFDPKVPRGEDIDFLINAKMFGFSFFLDNQLSIKHLPPPKTHSAWRQLREDIYRFVYERMKIQNQREIYGMTKVQPEDFDPYPGCFLKNNLEEKIEKSCRLLSEEYLTQGKIKDSEESLNNIKLGKSDAVPKFDPFKYLCRLQKQWSELMKYASKREIRSYMREVIKGKR